MIPFCKKKGLTLNNSHTIPKSSKPQKEQTPQKISTNPLKYVKNAEEFKEKCLGEMTLPEVNFNISFKSYFLCPVYNIQSHIILFSVNFNVL